MVQLRTISWLNWIPRAATLLHQLLGSGELGGDSDTHGVHGVPCVVVAWLCR